MFTRDTARTLVDEALRHAISLRTKDGWPSVDDVARCLRQHLDDVRPVDVLMDATEPALYVMDRLGDSQVLTLLVPSEGARFSGADLHLDGSVSRFNGAFYA
ncbi:MAG: hypothetical protein WD981_05450 [Gaiellaceae bacterium]